jgi:hypothetical protein
LEVRNRKTMSTIHEEVPAVLADVGAEDQKPTAETEQAIYTPEQIEAARLEMLEDLEVAAARERLKGHAASFTGGELTASAVEVLPVDAVRNLDTIINGVSGRSAETKIAA